MTTRSRTRRTNDRTRTVRARRERGITLLESLVSILILAVAVLGMLGVQLRTLAETQTGVRRSQAVRLIEDFAERFRSNPAAFANLASYVSGWANVPTGSDCVTAVCTPAQLARWDVQQWKQSIANILPGAQASIFLLPGEGTNPGNRRQLGIMIGWRVNERTAAAGYLAPFDVSTGSPETCPAGLICHLVYVQP